MFLRLGRIEANVDCGSRLPGERLAWAETWQGPRHREVEARLGLVHLTISTLTHPKGEAPQG